MNANKRMLHLISVFLKLKVKYFKGNFDKECKMLEDEFF